MDDVAAAATNCLLLYGHGLHAFEVVVELLVELVVGALGGLAELRGVDV